MGCGCGKKTTVRPSVAGNQGVQLNMSGSSNTTIANAQAFQSATIQKAPQAPILRKTV